MFKDSKTASLPRRVGGDWQGSNGLFQRKGPVFEPGLEQVEIVGAARDGALPARQARYCSHTVISDTRDITAGRTELEGKGFAVVNPYVIDFRRRFIHGFESTVRRKAGEASE